MHFTMSHTTSLLCVSYLDHLSQIVTNIREIILQTTKVFFRRAWWKEVVVTENIQTRHRDYTQRQRKDELSFNPFQV